MKSLIVFICLILTVLPAKATTRQEAIVAAVGQVSKSYSSAATGTTELLGNLFHANYSNGSPAHSPWWNSGWPGYPDTKNPLGGTWSGQPFMLGGMKVDTDCQNSLDAGMGLSAYSSHLDGNGETNSWASGVDCASFIGWASGIGPSVSTWSLVDPGYSDLIDWDDLSQADWLVYRPQTGYGDSRMFSKWDVFGSSLTYVYSSAVYWVVSLITNVDVQTLISDGYNPYEPNHYGGGTAAALLYFKAEMVNGTMTLSWQTVREHNTHFFRIERSLTEDGPRVVVAEIDQQGTDTSGGWYEVTDPDYQGGPIWYFLVEVEVTLREYVKQRLYFSNP